jgi:hypothetical protein
MRKVIAISGEPGTGKTTLMWKFIDEYNWINVEPLKSLPCLYNEELDLYILGKYEKGEVFAGTDRYSMSIQPTATEFIKKTTSNILFEGDRLTNGKFYDFLLSLPNTEVKFLVIQADRTTLNERYEKRGSNQSETFLKGRQTKISNILGNFEYMDYTETLKNENFEDQSKIINTIKEFL